MTAEEDEDEFEIDDRAEEEKLESEPEFSDEEDDFEALIKAGKFNMDEDEDDADFGGESNAFGFEEDEGPHLFGSLSGFEESRGNDRNREGYSSRSYDWDDDEY